MNIQNNSQKYNKKMVIYSTITLLIMALIFFFSSQEAEDSMYVSDTTLSFIIETVGHSLSDSVQLFLEEYIRKVAHFTIYMILGMFAYLTLWEWKSDILPKRQIFQFSLIFSFVYAMTDEFHQKFVAGRSCEWNDVCLDSIGALTGIVILIGLRYLLSNKNKRHSKKHAVPS